MATTTNGSKQGAVLSPPCFAIYLDDLIKELRALGLGCYIANKFVGATAYADDLMLLAPTRSAMKEMLKVANDMLLITILASLLILILQKARPRLSTYVEI